MIRLCQLSLVALLASSASLACNSSKAEAGVSSKSESSTSTSTASASASVAPAKAESVTNAAPRFDEEAFEVSIEAAPTVKAGAEFDVKVQLKAKAGYKVNQEYPIKFVFSEASGIRYATGTLRKEQGVIEKTSATLGGKATVSTAGAANVAGRLSFSVCTEERCLIEKRDLQVSVTAS